ncbi:MAG: YggS family pyridoxal phosphate-dependent enzyme [Gammaproteobacteria bacterium]|nr:YggS family pyridoxal phosphate-dependent enzyme [Gammaproteobacteria bacterium]MDH5802121.1 YggS family pyridoxal phosphate-dependent enzyme [Gammaproteobacteria bacterium]
MASRIQQNIQQYLQIIHQACQSCGRTDPVLLLAVSKKRSVDDIREAVAAGCTNFGESYVQEAVSKIQLLQDHSPPLNWHFIGPIQSNKAALISEYFHWVHSLDRAKVALKLNEARPSSMQPLNVCIQVNISGEAAKSGVSYELLDDLLAVVQKCPRLRLRGLMAIGLNTDDKARLRQMFAQLRQTLERLNSAGLALDTLSMGMTQDLHEAIVEGSTIVRVGTGIFGPR